MSPIPEFGIEPIDENGRGPGIAFYVVVWLLFCCIITQHQCLFGVMFKLHRVNVSQKTGPLL